MNLLDIASYLPKLGRLTASLASSADEDSREYGAVQRNPRKTSRTKRGGVVMLKTPVVTSHPNAYRSTQWTRSPSPARKQKRTSLVVSKVTKVQPQKKKQSIRPTSRPTGKLVKAVPQNKNAEAAPKDLRLIQQALDEFKTERDQFVHSLGGLQRKLLKFRIPNLFSSAVNLETLTDKLKLPPPPEKKIDEKPKEKSNKKTSRAKDVRSVSQHFYLADMTESDSSSSTSSSSSSSSSDGSGDASELELAKRKVSKFLDYDLIPIQPPENRRPEKANSLLIQGRKPAAKKPAKPGSAKPLNAQLTQLRRNVSEMAKKIPTRGETAKQKTAQQKTAQRASATKQKAAPRATRGAEAPAPPEPEPWGQQQPLTPKTKAAVTSEFRKLKKASELKLRNKLKKTVTNISH